MANPNIVFRFDLSKDGKSLEWTPNRPWMYFHDSVIRFETDSGPFELETTSTTGGLQDPFGVPLKSNNSNTGTWSLEVSVNDQLTPEERTRIWESHGGKRGGFIGMYKCVVKSPAGGGLQFPPNQNDIGYQC